MEHSFTLTNQTSGFLEYYVIYHIPLKVPATLRTFTASLDLWFVDGFSKGSITLPQHPAMYAMPAGNMQLKLTSKPFHFVYILPFILVRYCNASYNYLVMLFPTWKVPPFINFINFLPPPKNIQKHLPLKQPRVTERSTDVKVVVFNNNVAIVWAPQVKTKCVRWMLDWLGSQIAQFQWY